MAPDSPAPPSRRVSAGARIAQVAVILLVLAVVIAVGIPVAHQRALREERREARMALEDIQRAEERALLRDGRYAASLTAPSPQGLGRSAHSVRGRYVLSVEATAGTAIPSFVARAHSARDTDPACSSFSLTQSGVRGAADAQGRDTTDQCWR
jgi:type IV pilus assembly protein PilE